MKLIHEYRFDKILSIKIKRVPGSDNWTFKLKIADIEGFSNPQNHLRHNEPLLIVTGAH